MELLHLAQEFLRETVMDYETEIVIRNRLGLHARPAFRFAQVASSFQSEIRLIRSGEAVDGKSILEVLTLACPKGSRMAIRACGPDAKEAVEKLKALVDTGFGEIDL